MKKRQNCLKTVFSASARKNRSRPGKSGSQPDLARSGQIWPDLARSGWEPDFPGRPRFSWPAPIFPAPGNSYIDNFMTGFQGARLTWKVWINSRSEIYFQEGTFSGPPKKSTFRSQKSGFPKKPIFLLRKSIFSAPQEFQDPPNLGAENPEKSLLSGFSRFCDFFAPARIFLPSGWRFFWGTYFFMGVKKIQTEVIKIYNRRFEIFLEL